MQRSPVGFEGRTACDVLLVGGGLANSLIALELKSRRPTIRVVMLERRPTPGETHTWCAFRSDLFDGAWSLLSPTFENVWEGYDVAFPTHRRRLRAPYARLTDRSLGAEVENALGDGLKRGANVRSISPTEAVCEDGRVFSAPLVIDGRGFSGSPTLRLAYQKFVGLEVDLAEPHGLDAPVMMDATVPQIDGFRFVYVLPLATRRLLIEDTRYSDGAALDPEAMELGLGRFAKDRGWRVVEVVRREHGVLPIVLDGDIDAFWRDTAPGVPTVGTAGAFFHPTTGYSLPDAARVAKAIADCVTLTSAVVRPLVETLSRRLWARGQFYRALNRMMFDAAAADRRYVILQRFYGLPQALIERFYARRLTIADTLRIVTGRPPIPIGRAVRAIFNTSGTAELA